MLASAGEQDALHGYRERMGWDLPWYTTRDDFSTDFDVPQYFGINVFVRDGDDIYRSYFTTARSAEEISNVWGLLDLTPYGRQENWQDAPEGVPQGQAYSWGNRHIDYTEDELAGAAAPSGAGR